MPAADLIAELEDRLQPLEIEVARTWWDANTTSSEETEWRRQDAELRLRAALGDHVAFDAVRAGLASATDEPERRRLERLHAAMLPNQLDDERRRALVELETRVEGIYNTHRGEVDGRRVNDNEIARVLLESDDPGLRQRAWEASKSVGAAVADLVLELVHLRNEAARSLGHRDHFAMALALGELDEDRLAATLDEVDRATAAPFAAWKASLDEERATRFGCAPAGLRPWHYDDPFFQEPPRKGDLDLDRYFAAADLEALTLQTYDGIGLDLRPVLARSDLYARDGKSQHAFCIDIDREGDVRVLANAVPNERWMGTMLHEFGHAAYDRHIDRDVPFLLRRATHMLVTEAVAMLFGALSRDSGWLTVVGGLAAPEADRLGGELDEARRAAALVFARWALVVINFERDLYRDPGADHDSRWWELVERYQLVTCPDDPPLGTWAAKVHLALAPVYYQNYLYGELVASQLRAALDRDAGGVVGRPDAGRWLIDRVFAPGASVRWDRLIEAATGEPLDVRHFVDRIGG